LWLSTIGDPRTESKPILAWAQVPQRVISTQNISIEFVVVFEAV
jgi:hypothetical protein